MNKFNILGKLGSGSFSNVYRVKHKDNGETFAMKRVKIFKLSSKEKANAINEIRILASIK